MSSTSIARQNRRMRQRQLPPMTHSDSTSSRDFPSSSSQGLSVINAESYENTSNLNEGGEMSDFGSKVDVDKLPIPAITGCSFINCDVSSRPIGKIFVEEERGFKAIDESQMFHSLSDEHFQEDIPTEQAIDLAYKATVYFHKFSFLCHGLLGGMSFIETLLLFHLILTPSVEEDTLKHFRFLSEPVHNLFNFFCIMCCVSSFDRFDIANLKELFKYTKKYKIKVIVIIIYPICLLLSLSTANVDEKLCLPERNSTIWESFKLKGAENELLYWKTLSISKCIGAVLAWILISIDPNQNLFLQHLKNVLQRSKK